MLNIGVLRESGSETRVSLIPDTVAALTRNNTTVFVEYDAGIAAAHNNAQYEKAGAILQSRDEILRQASVLLHINVPAASDLDAAPQALWIGVYHPLMHPEIMQQWAQKGITAFSLDLLPRTTRAQAMDVLSSQANIAGYKAVLLAANIYPRYFPMFMTAAGSIAPAKVLILGAGVAGLQAIATAKRLGAMVEVFDTRPAVKEEVMSLGAKFVEVEGGADASQAGGYAVEQSEAFQQKQKAKIGEHAAKADIIITTAQIPGRKAPVLITKEMMDSMKTGSVIIDLAAATGGNTDFTRDRETVIRNGITIIGDSALFTTMPADASKMYSKNIQNFLKLLTDTEGNLNLNFEDDLVKGACVVHKGKICNERLEHLMKGVKI